MMRTTVATMTTTTTTTTTIILIVAISTSLVGAQPEHTDKCRDELAVCEKDLECSNRLAPLMAACVTGTCQPQCRMAVLNLYQTKLGRALLSGDASCIPGRDELRICHFLPAERPLHCSLAKLMCESNLSCNAKWEVFVSECESETKRGACADDCPARLQAVLSVPAGAALSDCSCTEKDDQLCANLRDALLKPCLAVTSPDGRAAVELPSPPTPPPPPASVETAGTAEETDGSPVPQQPSATGTTRVAAALLALVMLRIL